MRSLTDLSCSAASREASINMRSVTLSGMRSVFFKSLANSDSSWVSCYDALVRACLVERAEASAIRLACVRGGLWPFVGTVDVSQALAANDADFAVAAGFVGEHLDGLPTAHIATAADRNNFQRLAVVPVVIYRCNSFAINTEMLSGPSQLACANSLSNCLMGLVLRRSQWIYAVDGAAWRAAEAAGAAADDLHTPAGFACESGLPGHLDGLFSCRISQKRPVNIGPQRFALNPGLPLYGRTLLCGDSGLLPLVDDSGAAQLERSSQSTSPARFFDGRFQAFFD